MFTHPNREAARALPLYFGLLLTLVSCSGGGGGVDGVDPGTGGPPRDVSGSWSARAEITETSSLLSELKGEVVTGTFWIDQEERSIEVTDGSGLIAYGDVDGNMVHFTQVYTQSGITVKQTYDLVISTDGRQMPGSLDITVDSSQGSGWARGPVSASRNQSSPQGGGGGSFLAVNADRETSSSVFLRLEVEGCGEPAMLGILHPGEALEIALPEVPCTVLLVEARDAQPEGALDEASGGTVVLYRAPESSEPESCNFGDIVDLIVTR